MKYEFDLARDELLSFKDLSKRLPGRPNISTIWRWSAKGLHGIRLPVLMLGGTRYTTMEAVQRWAETVTSVRTGESYHPAKPSKARQRQIDACENELKKLGC